MQRVIDDHARAVASMKQSAEARTLPLFPEKPRMSEADETTTTATKPRAKPGPKPLDLVDLHAKIRKRHSAKIERVRKQQRLETTSAALRFMLDEWG